MKPQLSKKHQSRSTRSEINLNQSHSAKASRDLRKSPSISRSITESVLTFVRDEKYVLLASLTGVFFFCWVLFLTVQLSHALQQQKSIEAQRKKVVSDIRFWEKVTVEKPDYRDGYFMLAVLQYRLGKKDEASVNVKKALELDPNFKEGREFERKLKSN